MAPKKPLAIDPKSGHATNTLPPAQAVAVASSGDKKSTTRDDSSLASSTVAAVATTGASSGYGDVMSLRARLSHAIRTALPDFPVVLLPLVVAYSGSRAIVIPCVNKYSGQYIDGTPNSWSSLYYWISTDEQPFALSASAAAAAAAYMAAEDAKREAGRPKKSAPERFSSLATDRTYFTAESTELIKDLELNDMGGRLFRLPNGCTGYAVDDGIQVYGPTVRYSKYATAATAVDAAPEVGYAFRYLLPGTVQQLEMLTPPALDSITRTGAVYVLTANDNAQLQLWEVPAETAAGTGAFDPNDTDLKVAASLERKRKAIAAGKGGGGDDEDDDDDGGGGSDIIGPDGYRARPYPPPGGAGSEWLPTPGPKPEVVSIMIELKALVKIGYADPMDTAIEFVVLPPTIASASASSSLSAAASIDSAAVTRVMYCHRGYGVGRAEIDWHKKTITKVWSYDCVEPKTAWDVPRSGSNSTSTVRPGEAGRRAFSVPVLLCGNPAAAADGSGGDEKARGASSLVAIAERIIGTDGQEHFMAFSVLDTVTGAMSRTEVVDGIHPNYHSFPHTIALPSPPGKPNEYRFLFVWNEEQRVFAVTRAAHPSLVAGDERSTAPGSHGLHTGEWVVSCVARVRRNNASDLSKLSLSPDRQFMALALGSSYDNPKSVLRRTCDLRDIATLHFSGVSYPEAAKDSYSRQPRPVPTRFLPDDRLVCVADYDSKTCIITRESVNRSHPVVAKRWAELDAAVASGSAERVYWTEAADHPNVTGLPEIVLAPAAVLRTAHKIRRLEIADFLF